MSDKIAVSQIEIKIGKNVLKLSLAQMKELKDLLNWTFPDENTVHAPIDFNPPPREYRDVIYINPYFPPRRDWEVICGDSTSSTLRIEARHHVY